MLFPKFYPWVKLVYNFPVRTILFLILALPLFARAECQDLQHVYGTIDLVKKTWITEDNAEPISWCLPLVKKNHNILITLKKDGRTYKVGMFQSLYVFWDEIKDKKLTGGVQKATSIMVQVPLPDWYKGARVTVTDASTLEIIAEGTL